MNSTRVTVVDLGSAKTVCLVAEMSERGKVRVVGSGVEPSKGLRRGAVVDLDEATRSVREALKQAHDGGSGEGEHAFVGVGSPLVHGATARGYVPLYPKSRQITREDVLQVIKHSRQVSLPPDEEQIQAMPQTFSVDGQNGIQKPIGMSGGRLEVTTFLVTGQTSHIQNIERAVTQCGLKVEQMVLQSLASGLGVLSPEALDHGCAVIDLGAGTTDIAVFDKGALTASVSLPVGSQLVTSDLSKLLKTSPDEAERLKTEFGSVQLEGIPETETVPVLQLGQAHTRPLARRVLCEIIQSRVREIATMVRQQIEKSGTLGVLPGGVVLTGGGSLLPGIDRLFEETLNQGPVRIGRPKDAGFDFAGSDEPGMASAAGLVRFALQNFDDEFSPVGGTDDWKDRIRTFWSLLSGRA
ncbi:MAG: cell division protein FtsA [Fimbriimonadaceae bacterium]|nr:cell division protein FtsA [Chthonomonadaceae bacterium]MCO5297611.1 cell division protein FtsA [Fimbriimonadaceae bacterium]